MASTESETLARTPLYDLHVELGARMVPFAGYEMPVQYPAGIMKEHQQTRESAGLFDVSHMGQVLLHGERAALGMETLVPVDIVDLAVNTQRYALFTNEQGGIMDDLMVSNGGDSLFVVVNAACKEQDIAHMRAGLSGYCELEVIEDRALLALQGPKAGEVLARLAPSTGDMVFMDTGTVELLGCECMISRSGYTGEDGFEISVPADRAEELARTLLSQDEVGPVGLGARDSLRLEAGLCLYGNDIDSETTPVEASLLWALSKVRRAAGERPGGYPGADIIMAQMADGVQRKRVGLLPQGRAPVRAGVGLVDAEGQDIGAVTSGCFGPTLGGPVAMGYVHTHLAKLGTEIGAMVRGKSLPVVVARAPFVQQRYYRG